MTITISFERIQQLSEKASELKGSYSKHLDVLIQKDKDNIRLRPNYNKDASYIVYRDGIVFKKELRNAHNTKSVEAT